MYSLNTYIDLLAISIPTYYSTQVQIIMYVDLGVLLVYLLDK